MAWKDISSAIIDPTLAKRTRRMGIDKPTPLQNVLRCLSLVCRSYDEDRNSHGRLDEMGLKELTKISPHNKRTPTGLEYLNPYYIKTTYLRPRRNLENS
jgi:hypothetical protein